MKNLPQLRSFKDFFIFSKATFYRLYFSLFGSFLEKRALRIGTIIYTSPIGFKTKLKLNRVVDRYFYIGSFERDTFKFFIDLLQPNMTILDIGANIGLFSLTACAVLKDKCKIFAFEPAEEVNEDFKTNIGLNNFKNIKIIKKGVSDRTGEIKFNICEDNAYNSINGSPMNSIVKTINIPTVSIDDFCFSENIKNVDIVKVDTEGAEYLVLQGGKKLFSSENAPILFIEYNTPILSEVQLTLIRNSIIFYGYLIYEIRFGIIQPFDPLISNSVDLICLKKNHISRLRIDR